MKNLITFSLIMTMSLVTSLSKAETVMIRAPGASALSYESFLRQTPKVISYVDYQQRKLQIQPQQEQQVFSLADSFVNSPELTLLHLKGLQSSSPWTLMSLRFVRDLTEKSLQNSGANLRRDLQNLYCKTAVLLNEGSLSTPCSTQFVSLETLKRKFPKAEKVLIETLGFSLSDPANPAIASQMNYHWTFLSNTGKAVSFYGTYEQLFQQSFDFSDSVNGTCDGFTTEFDDLVLQTSGRIYFSEACQKNLLQVETNSKSWIIEKRTWWIAAGLVIIGGLAYSLKDKDIAIKAPSLKF